MVLGLDFFFEEFLTFPKTYVKYDFSDAGVAQLVERNLAKVEVASSRLVSRSRIQEKRKRQASFFRLYAPKSRERPKHRLRCRNDGIGRRSGLKIRRNKIAYGFDPRFRHHQTSGPADTRGAFFLVDPPVPTSELFGLRA